LQAFKLHISRFIILIVAIQLVNISIQAHPANEVLLTHSYQDDNRIDDAVEYVLEILMHKKDAIPEDKHQKQDHSFHAKSIDFKLLVPHYNAITPTFTVVEMRKPFSNYKLYSYRFSTEINPPPPKA
jgi:hypothetical protein